MIDIPRGAVPLLGDDEQEVSAERFELAPQPPNP